MSDEAETAVKAAARILVAAVLDLIQGDPHQWSERPCPTCRPISHILGKPFGCYVFALQRQRERALPPVADKDRVKP